MHGINTTVVEIDPAVAEFATRYFRIPHNFTTVVEDAVTYTRRAVEEGQTFDYIIHDVFTGGAEPIPLFTIEFILSLYDLLTPSGVVAIVSCVFCFTIPATLQLLLRHSSQQPDYP